MFSRVAFIETLFGKSIRLSANIVIIFFNISKIQALYTYMQDWSILYKFTSMDLDLVQALKSLFGHGGISGVPYTGKYSPISSSLSVSEFKTGRIPMSHVIFLWTHLCLGEFKTWQHCLQVYRGENIARGENNPVYSMYSLVCFPDVVRPQLYPERSLVCNGEFVI